MAHASNVKKENMALTDVFRRFRRPKEIAKELHGSI